MISSKKTRMHSLLPFFSKVLIVVVLGFSIISPVLLFAQPPSGGSVGPTPGDTEVNIPNPLEGAGADNLLDFMKLVFDNVIIPIGGIVLALGIIWSGFLFVTAQGNPAKLATAQKAFFWSFIGGLVLLGAWAIAKGIESTINSIRGLP